MTAMVDADVIVAGGQVVDGSGAPGYRADVGIAGGRIAAIGDLSATPAALRLDAAGAVVAPGFVDPHTAEVRPREGRLREIGRAHV